MLERTPVRLQEQGAFPALRGNADIASAGIVVSERRPQLATVMALRNRRADLAARLGAFSGLVLPDGPGRNTAGADAIMGLGPRTWLYQRVGGTGLERQLAGALGDAAAVTDQSDGYAVLAITGPRVRSLLEKCVSIDLHEKSFGVGRVASTSCAHIGIILWRLDDVGGMAVFELAVFRSYARSLWHFVDESAAEYGLAIAG